MSRDPATDPNGPRSATPDEMRDVRVSIIVAIMDEPNRRWTAQGLLQFFNGSGEYTELPWIEEALHQLLWVDVLTKHDPRSYGPGDKFHQYINEMSAHIEKGS